MIRRALPICAAILVGGGLLAGCGGGDDIQATTKTTTETTNATKPSEKEATPTAPASDAKRAQRAKSRQAPKPAQTEDASKSPSQTEVIAEKLATIEAEGPPDEALIGQFDAALSRMEPHCNEPPIEISDDTVTAQQLLAEAGISESLLSILTHVQKSIPGALGKTKCFEVFAAYVTLRKSG